jgi:hypothetical protein
MGLQRGCIQLAGVLLAFKLDGIGSLEPLGLLSFQDVHSKATTLVSHEFPDA